jgi:hypothetical protein
LANQATIDEVKSNLPSWITDQTDWDDAKIGAALDGNRQNPLVVTRLFWLQRVSDLTAITDVSDAGGARPMSQTYQHAMDMFKYWDSIAGFQSTSVGKIRRRYKRRHGYGLSEYGGTYGRVD